MHSSPLFSSSLSPPLSLSSPPRRRAACSRGTSSCCWCCCCDATLSPLSPSRSASEPEPPHERQARPQRQRHEEDDGRLRDLALCRALGQRLDAGLREHDPGDRDEGEPCRGDELGREAAVGLLFFGGWGRGKREKKKGESVFCRTANDDDDKQMHRSNAYAIRFVSFPQNSKFQCSKEEETLKHPTALTSTWFRSPKRERRAF